LQNELTSEVLKKRINDPNETLRENDRSLRRTWIAAASDAHTEGVSRMEAFDVRLYGTLVKASDAVHPESFRVTKEMFLRSLLIKHAKQCDHIPPPAGATQDSYLRSLVCDQCCWMTTLLLTELVRLEQRVQRGWERSQPGVLRAEALVNHDKRVLSARLAYAILRNNPVALSFTPNAELDYLQRLHQQLFANSTSDHLASTD
jgi:hypothetical protein